MLSIEEIKKACEFAEGFELRRKTIYVPNGGYIIVEHLNIHKVIYPLFLQRVIEGINEEYDKKGDYWINCYFNQICIYSVHSNMCDANWYIQEFQGDIDQAKEEAIKYILGKINA